MRNSIRARALTKIGVICASGLLGLANCALLISTNVYDLQTTNLSFVKVGDVPHPEGSRGWPLKEDRGVILLTLTTTYDLEGTAKERGLFNLHAGVDFCGTSDKAAVSAVYEFGQQIPAPSDEPGKRETETTSPHLYQVWFNYRTYLHRSGGGFIDYDLSKEPRDLCIKISGSPYMGIGVGLVTNTVTVSATKITAALMDGPAQLP